MPSAIGSHPWAIHLFPRRGYKFTSNIDELDRSPAPHKFNDYELIRAPSSRADTIRECVTLDDVVFYRDETTRIRKKKGKTDEVSDLSDRMGNLSIEKKHFRIIYRYTDVVQKESLAILEAIHFEIFMPDRPDLRFIALPLTLLPWNTCEGDYFEIYGVNHTPKLSTMHVGMEYPVVWTVTSFCRVERQGKPAIDYVYVAEKVSDDRKAVCNRTNNFILPRHRRFNQTDTEKNMEVNRIYDANLVDTSSAWIYPVEPPINLGEYAKLVQNVKSTSHFAGTFAQEIFVLSKTEQDRIDDRLEDFNEFNKNMEMAEQHMIRLFKLGVRYRQLITPPTKENVFVQSFDPPRLQVYTEVFYLDAVTVHLEQQDVKLMVENIKRETMGKRKNTYISCVHSDDLVRVLGSRPAKFWVEATFHGEGGSATEKILDKIEYQMKKTEQHGEVEDHYLIDAEIPKMIHAMYGQNFKKDKYRTAGCCIVQKSNGQELKLNTEQTRAMSIYHKIANSGYCILSPPGSGKTTVAAAMAASLAKDDDANRQGSVQMLLAVQNVAVENLAIALKSFDDGSLRSYRLLSKLRTDPNDPTPYDIFEHFPDYMRWMSNAKTKELNVMHHFFEVEEQWKKSKLPGSTLSKRNKDELNREYNLAIFAAKAVLQKYMEPEIILSTVDLALYKLLEEANGGVRGQFWDVDRIIIDEASLLTESTFYCLVRCFPKASFVLIGDDKQLPPFMYDHKILGHELAGRAALNVAMQRKNLPIIQLVEVYRAPQQLVQPYNNLSYDGTLVSRKKELCRPLLSAGLVTETRPDLLLIDIAKGHQKGSPSPYNQLEIDVLVRLLNIFPKSTHDDIMIICLYKAQKKRLQTRLGPDYEIMTVDSSQGKEKSIVIVLTTRTEKVTDFFCNQNRCTVAVSRHQRSLIILGNNSLLSHQHPWSKVLEDFTKIEPAQIPGPKWTPIPVKAAKKKPIQTKQAQPTLKKATAKVNQTSKPSPVCKKALLIQKAKPAQAPKKQVAPPKQKSVAASAATKPIVKTRWAPTRPPIPSYEQLPQKTQPVQKAVVVPKKVPISKPSSVLTAVKKFLAKTVADSEIEGEKKKGRKKKTTKQRNDQRKRAKARAEAEAANKPVISGDSN